MKLDRGWRQRELYHQPNISERRQYSIVCKDTAYGLSNLELECWEEQIFFFLASYSVGTRVSCLGVQKQGHEDGHSPLSGVGVICDDGVYMDNLSLF
jgi:hypothetical protein